jgi:hypothetical protein
MTERRTIRLGHSARQKQLEQDLKCAWEQDPVAVIETGKMEGITETILSGYSGGAGGNRTKNDVENVEVIESTKREKC